MSDQLGAVLLQYRVTITRKSGRQLKTFEVPGRQGRSEMVQFVFAARSGGPLCADNFRSRVFYKLIEMADVPRFRFHDIRHTFAVLLLSQVESMHYVNEEMGHASIQTTVDVHRLPVPRIDPERCRSAG